MLEMTIPSPRSLKVDQTWGALIAFTPHSTVVGLAFERVAVSFGIGYSWFARISFTSGRAAIAWSSCFVRPT